jgi:hypothetical protein
LPPAIELPALERSRVSEVKVVVDITVFLSIAKLFYSLAVSLPDPSGYALRLTRTGVI